MRHPGLQPGHFYEHPEDGPIRITSGEYLSNERISNFWYWVVVETGEKKHGYGAPWPDISSEWGMSYHRHEWVDSQDLNSPETNESICIHCGAER